MAWATPKSFINATLNHSYDMDGYPRGQKYQCWDYADYFWVNQVGRIFITKAGGGCILDAWRISRQINAGNEFDIITRFDQLKEGDWAAFGGTKTGHIGIVVSRGGNTVVLQGQNQGEIKTKVTRITMPSTYFLGAWRYKGWNQAPIQKFLPPRGYWKFGDIDPRVGEMSAWMRRTFPAYTPASATGKYFGPSLLKAVKEFQRRTGLLADGNVGPQTYAKMQSFGFKG